MDLDQQSEQVGQALPAVKEPSLPFEPEMVLIPAGEFPMGSDPNKDEKARDNELSQHRLHLADYYLSRTPLTNAQYAAFVRETGGDAPKHWGGGTLPGDEEDHPVTRISWNDAMAYCRWLSEITGKPYGLPSEAQWEKGARGTDGLIFPWGNEWDPQRCNSREAGPGGTTRVGTFPAGASPYGLLDTAGNVWEWTRSLLKPYPYKSDDGREDLEVEGARVLRGGSFVSRSGGVRCANRGKRGSHVHHEYGGFRVLLAVPSSQA
jgi:formylglycine-generating enzyme required for sulfatase activity